MTGSNTAVFAEQVLEEASLWVARLDRGLSDDERLQLDDFLSTAEARAAFLELAALSDRLNELAELVPATEPRSAGSRPVYLRYGMAAGFLLLAVLGLAYLSGALTSDVQQLPAPQLVVYETSVGEQSIVTLQDGSRVSLNTDSQLRVAFTDSGRLAILDRGEAHFAVASDAYRPFSVRSGPCLVQVLGTRFSVYRRNDDTTEVVVEEGAVRVAATGDAELSSARGSTRPPKLIVGGDRLTAGDVGLFREGGGTVTAVDELTLDAKLSWRDGRLVFRGETLEEALADIGRYTSTRFEFLDEKAKGISVAGVFKSGDVDGLLQTLAANFHIAYQRFDDELILISLR